MADAFGSRVVNVGDIGMADELAPLDDVTERFAGLCDRAAEHGLLVALEFLPWSGIPDVATAWRIVDGAGRANGGILVDTWHHLRGVADDAALRAVPGDRVYVVQVSDAPAEPEGPYMEDTTLRRRLPGEGALDLVGFLRTLEAMGVDCPISVELFNPEFQALPADQAARLVHDATRALVAEARREPSSCGGRLFQATSLSTRMSPGRPRTRSPRMLRMTSDVPPSIEFARLRRNHSWTVS